MVCVSGSALFFIYIYILCDIKYNITYKVLYSKQISCFNKTHTRKKEEPEIHLWSFLKIYHIKYIHIQTLLIFFNHEPRIFRDIQDGHFLSYKRSNVFILTIIFFVFCHMWYLPLYKKVSKKQDKYGISYYDDLINNP